MKLLLRITILSTLALTSCFLAPEYKGRVIDSETKEPIEGASAIAVYWTAHREMIEVGSTILDIREVLTDKDGMFVIPTKFAFIFPSWQETTRFLIYKRGYSYFPDYGQSKPILNSFEQEAFFSGVVGKVQEMTACASYPPSHTRSRCTKNRVEMGVVELQKLKTKEERRKVHVSYFGSGQFDVKQPHLINSLNEEYEYLFHEKVETIFRPGSVTIIPFIRMREPDGKPQKKDVK